MKRPLLPSERVTVDVAESVQGNPAITDVFAQVLFVFGMVIGHYPSAQIDVSCDTDPAGGALEIQIGLRVPLEELGQ